MSIIDKLKDLKDQLPKVALNEKVQKENNDLTDQISELQPIDGETIHNPYAGPPKEEYILLNTFSARFEKADCFIKPDQIFAVTKPNYDIANNQLEHEFKISFTAIDVQHYFGKPSEYTNFKTDQEIISLIRSYNQKASRWFELTEYSDKSETPRLTTRYLDPKITKLEFSESDTMVSGVIKYYTITIVYSKVISTKGKFEDVKEKEQ